MKIIRNYDVTSLYPSIMINYGFLSRNVRDPLSYEDSYHKRIEAKKSGDKAVADALKLVLSNGF